MKVLKQHRHRAKGSIPVLAVAFSVMWIAYLSPSIYQMKTKFLPPKLIEEEAIRRRAAYVHQAPRLLKRPTEKSNKDQERADWGRKPRMLSQNGFAMTLEWELLPRARASNRTIEVPPAKKDTPGIDFPKKPLCKTKDCELPGGGSWQYSNNMTCNSIHEVDLSSVTDSSIHLIGKGGQRVVWSFAENDGYTNRVLKMLRLKGPSDTIVDFNPKTFEQHRRDAVINEKVSSLPNIASIHGFCGNSGLYDYADATLATNLINNGPPHHDELLNVASEIASSVAELHDLDELSRPMIVHTDLHTKQWVYVNGGYQLTDFNAARILTWSPKTNSTIPFRKQKLSKNASPEEHKGGRIGTEKIDIWRLGHVLHSLLTGKFPYEDQSTQQAKDLILAGIPPEIPQRKRKSQDPVNLAMVKAIDWCMKLDPQERPTAREVAALLTGAADSYAAEHRTIPAFAFGRDITPS